MLHSILAPVDGTPSGAQALPLAVRLAARDNARLDLVLVTDPIAPHERARGAPVPDPRLDYDLRREKTAYLTTLAARIARDHPVRIEAGVEEGAVAETLARHAAEAGTDLVVMTTHYATGLRPTWLSSTAAALVRKLNVPMLVVKPVGSLEPRAAEVLPLRRVLIVLDGSEPAESILDSAVLVGGSEATYAVAGGVVPELGEALTAEILTVERNVTGAFRERLRGYLNEAASWVRGRGLRAETRILHGPDLSTAILDCAKAYRADLIAMAMPGRDLEERLVDNLVAQDVVGGGNVPLLLRRPAPAPRPVVLEASRR